MSDETWIFESLIGFLRGPIWNYPIQTFIEQRSIIFEENASTVDEEEYKKTHEEYKNLVDLMLSSYMEDLNISKEQFDKAMETATSKMKSKHCHLIFEEVWAADNFDLFKKMMTQKNIELQLQALNLLREKYGISLKPNKKDKVKQEARRKDSEEEVMKKIREQSMKEHRENAEAIDKELRDLEKALALSAEDHAQLSLKQKEHSKRLEEELRKTIATAPPESEDENVVGETSEVEDEEEKREKDKEEEEQEGEKEQEEENEELSNLEKEKEIERRAEFLRMQRDKLLAMKKAERERLLSESENSANVRPKSSKAARRGASESNAIDPQTLSIRKALVEKLKREVVNSEV